MNDNTGKGSYTLYNVKCKTFKTVYSDIQDTFYINSSQNLHLLGCTTYQNHIRLVVCIAKMCATVCMVHNGKFTFKTKKIK